MSNTLETIKAVKAALSPARIGTYEAATGAVCDTDSRAVALYAWTAQVSAALFAPLHICEVVIRNAAADALESVYGAQWPWNRRFVLSLPASLPNTGYSPRRDLESVSARQPSTGKVIPELKFVFWQHMFTHRHDGRIWSSHLKRILPFHDPAKTVVELRNAMYADLEAIRKLRNRIAHHEPIFARNLREDFERMVRLVDLRSKLVASWMSANQDAFRLISTPPIFRGGDLWIPSHEEIACLAFQLWSHGGRRPDSAEADWAAARHLLGKLS